MSRAMIQAAVTMGQLQNKLDVIGNNLANSQTNGFKRKQTEFSSMLVQQINNLTHASEERQTPEGIRVGTGARLGTIRQDSSIGSFKQTDRGLDIALRDPSHYLQVQVTEGGVTETRYTRDGALYLQPSANGDEVFLTNADGHPILGQNGSISIASGFESIRLTDEGSIVTTRNGVEQVEGQLAPVAIGQSRFLEQAGGNLLRLPTNDAIGASGVNVVQPVALNGAIISVGMLEQSNVDLADEMSELLMTQRAYQYNSRTLSMGDQMYGLINQLRS